MSEQKTTPTQLEDHPNVSRRHFMASAGAAAATWSVLQSQLAHGYAANAKVDLGLIGCGGRGAWIAELFQQHGGYNLVAAADYFPDRVNEVGNKFQLPESRRFSGLSGYHRMLEGELDAVVIESPPYFHPEQAKAAVAAGKHVYLAKPIAIDVPGCMTVEQSGRQATQRKLCFLVDFQTRADEFYTQAIQRVHAGAIGQFAFGEYVLAQIGWGEHVADTRSIDAAAKEFFLGLIGK